MMMPSNANFEQVCQIVAKKLNADAKHLFVADIFQHKIYREFREDDMLQEIARNDIIFMYTPISLYSC